MTDLIVLPVCKMSVHIAAGKNRIFTFFFLYILNRGFRIEKIIQHAGVMRTII